MLYMYTKMKLYLDVYFENSHFSAQYMELEDRQGRLEQELREKMAVDSK